MHNNIIRKYLRRIRLTITGIINRVWIVGRSNPIHCRPLEPLPYESHRKPIVRTRNWWTLGAKSQESLVTLVCRDFLMMLMHKMHRFNRFPVQIGIKKCIAKWSSDPRVRPIASAACAYPWQLFLCSSGANFDHGLKLLHQSFGSVILQVPCKIIY
jgi:hypothetical protein